MIKKLFLLSATITSPLFAMEHPEKPKKELPLILASKKGMLEDVQKLIGAKYDLEETDHLGATALICAATNGHVRITTLLLNAGANVKAKMKRGLSALDCVNQLLTGIKSLDECSEKGKSYLLIKQLLSLKTNMQPISFSFKFVEPKSGKESDLEFEIIDQE